MDTAFYDLFGQIGATVVSIAFTLFVGYLLYIKEQRDRIVNQLIGLRREMSSLVEQLSETPIPGVVHNLLNLGREGDEKWDKLSITEWVAGVSWKMRVEVGEVKENEVWNHVRKGLEDLVKGVLPEGSFPETETDIQSLGKWAENFVRDTEHIEWFCHEYGGYSWANSLVGKMREWEVEHFNHVLKSQDVALLLERLLLLRSLTNEALSLKRNHESLRIENAIGHYKSIIAGFLAMAFFSIFVPLMMLLFPPVGDSYIISVNKYTILVDTQYLSLASFLGFIFFSLLVMGLLLRTARK